MKFIYQNCVTSIFLAEPFTSLFSSSPCSLLTALAGLQLAIQTRLTLNSEVHLPLSQSAGIKRGYHYVPHSLYSYRAKKDLSLLTVCARVCACMCINAVIKRNRFKSSWWFSSLVPLRITTQIKWIILFLYHVKIAEFTGNKHENVNMRWYTIWGETLGDKEKKQGAADGAGREEWADTHGSGSREGMRYTQEQTQVWEQRGYEIDTTEFKERGGGNQVIKYHLILNFLTTFFLNVDFSKPWVCIYLKNIFSVSNMYTNLYISQVITTLTHVGKIFTHFTTW